MHERHLGNFGKARADLSRLQRQISHELQRQAAENSGNGHDCDMEQQQESQLMPVSREEAAPEPIKQASGSPIAFATCLKWYTRSRCGTGTRYGTPPMSTSRGSPPSPIAQHYISRSHAFVSSVIPRDVSLNGGWVRSGHSTIDTSTSAKFDCAPDRKTARRCKIIHFDMPRGSVECKACLFLLATQWRSDTINQ